MRVPGQVAVLFVLLVGFAQAQQVPLPLINQPLVPASVEPGHEAFVLTVNGTGFSPTASLNWNGSPRVTEVFSSSTLQAKIEAKNVKKAGTATITVLNPGSGVELSNVVYLPIRTPSKSVRMAAKNFTLRPSIDGGLADAAGTIAVGDFNGDGKLDVAVGISQNDGSSGAIEVYLGDGNGKFGAPVQTATSFVPYSMLTADFNGDGRMDVAVCSGPSDYVECIILLGNGDGSFNVVSSGIANILALGDFNGDGILDVVVNDYDGSDVAILLGNGDGTFQQAYWFEESSGIPAVGDFNGDGILDLAFSYYTVDIYLGNGDGTFQETASYRVDEGGNLQTADINGDGKLDLITNGVTVLLGNGDGTFQVGSSFYVGGYYTWAIADLNGDGKLDLAIPVLDNESFESLEIFLGDMAKEPKEYDFEDYTARLCVSGFRVRHGDGEAEAESSSVCEPASSGKCETGEPGISVDDRGRGLRLGRGSEVERIAKNHRGCVQ